jgi:hypothetical protein
MQRAELHDDQEQEDDHWPSGVQQVLPALPQASGTQGNEVTSFQQSAFSYQLMSGMVKEL